MNGTFASNVKHKLYPALNRSQGFTGTYSRGGTFKRLTAIPTNPDWVSTDDSGAIIEEWVGLVWLVSAEEWAATGLGVPQQNDRFTVTLADGVQMIYALLAPKGLRPYEMTANGSGYALKMKWVKG